jgi:hypoxanthine phosphoribosyltransferase
MDDIAYYIESSGGKALRWPDAFPAGNYPLESLIEASRTVDGALIIASPDDQGIRRDEMGWVPRDNVLVELGIFLSALSRHKAGLVSVSGEEGKPTLPSDLDGLTHIPFDKDIEVQNERAIKAWFSRFTEGETRPVSTLPTPKSGRYSWDDVMRGIGHIQEAMMRDEYVPDLVLGLGRSGGVVGGLLASHLGSLPFRVLDLEYSESKRELKVEFSGIPLDLPEEIKKVLVIEGATTGGTTPRYAEALLKKNVPEVEFRFAFLIQGETSHFTGDYYAFLESRPLAPLPWHGPRSKAYLTPSR